MNLNPIIVAITPLFLTAFLGLMVWVYKKSNRHHFEQMAKLPLETAKEGHAYVQR